MAVLNFDFDKAMRLIARLQIEHGQTVVSNFALDLELDAANAERANLLKMLDDANQRNVGLQERLIEADRVNESLREQIDPSRKGRFHRGANKNRSDNSDSARDADPFIDEHDNSGVRSNN